METPAVGADSLGQSAGTIPDQGSGVPVEPHDEFFFRDEEWGLVETAVKAAEAMLRLPDLEEEQRESLTRALSALQALPKSTPDMEETFGISVTRESGGYSRTLFWMICVATEWLSFSSGGHEYDPAIGGDSLPSESYEVDIDGDHSGDLDPYEWMNDVEAAIRRKFEFFSG